MFFEKCILPFNCCQTGFCCFVMGVIISLQTVNMLLNCSVVLRQFCNFYFNISNQDQNWVAKRKEISELQKLAMPKNRCFFKFYCNSLQDYTEKWAVIHMLLFCFIVIHSVPAVPSIQENLCLQCTPAKRTSNIRRVGEQDTIYV